MTAQFYEVDVWAGTRKFDDQTFRVAINWDPDYAEYTERLLNAHVWAAIRSASALNVEPADFRLVAFGVDARGRREREQAWLWRAPLDPREEKPWRS